MKLVAQNNKNALVPRTGIEYGSEPGLRYQKIGRDSGIPVFGIPGLQTIFASFFGGQWL
jgi:hypothetical protein